MANRKWPIITLLTDFGLKDPYVASMKGVILGINPQCLQVDITHQVNSHDIKEGAFILGQVYSNFPKGTIHLSVVDPGVGSARKPILIATKNYFFVGPDNGLFTIALRRESVKRAVVLTNQKFFLSKISSTFHGRDIFAPVAAHLSLGRQPEKITSGMDPRLNRSGSTLIVLAEHKAPVYSKQGLKLVTSTMRRPSPDVLDPKIHHSNLLNSILAKIQANAAGADDAIMLDLRGFIAETNATHLFLVQAGMVHTPTVAACPEGITRATVLALCRRHGIDHRVGDLSLAELYRADEVFCTGTMGELAGVTEVDGRSIGDGTIGPMTRRLSALYAECTASGGTRVEPGI